MSGRVEWLHRHWSSVVTIGCVIIAALIEAWQQAASGISVSPSFPRLQGDWHFVPLILLVIAGVVWLVGRRKSGNQQQLESTGAIVPGIPALSNLLGQNPAVDFDPKRFFTLAHYSPVTAEIEKNIKIVAQQHYPADKEAFYARFIGVGAVAYDHDTTWFTIYGSQLEALAEINSGGLVPIADLKKHYDKAASVYPKAYTNYTFEQWIDYMKSRRLIAVYPSRMVELSFNGKDFLKYLSHVGRDKIAKPN